MENIQQLNADDLRIGNLVEYENAIFEIDIIAREFPSLNTIAYGVGVVRWIDLKPIPLTEEWLLKFGFQKLYDNYYLLYVGSLTINYYYNYSGSTWKFMLEEQLLDIKYVHEVQNLYYSLTKTELTYERPTN